MAEQGEAVQNETVHDYSDNYYKEGSQNHYDFPLDDNLSKSLRLNTPVGESLQEQRTSRKMAIPLRRRSVFDDVLFNKEPSDEESLVENTDEEISEQVEKNKKVHKFQEFLDLLSPENVHEKLLPDVYESFLGLGQYDVEIKRKHKETLMQIVEGIVNLDADVSNKARLMEIAYFVIQNKAMDVSEIQFVQNMVRELIHDGDNKCIDIVVHIIQLDGRLCRQLFVDDFPALNPPLEHLDNQVVLLSHATRRIARMISKKGLSGAQEINGFSLTFYRSLQEKPEMIDEVKELIVAQLSVQLDMYYQARYDANTDTLNHDTILPLFQIIMIADDLELLSAENRTKGIELFREIFQRLYVPDQTKIVNNTHTPVLRSFAKKFQLDDIDKGIQSILLH